MHTRTHTHAHTHTLVSVSCNVSANWYKYLYLILGTQYHGYHRNTQCMPPYNISCRGCLSVWASMPICFACCLHSDYLHSCESDNAWPTACLYAHTIPATWVPFSIHIQCTPTCTVERIFFVVRSKFYLWVQFLHWPPKTYTQLILMIL